MPKECLPEKEIILEWFGQTVQMKSVYERYTKTIESLGKVLNNAELHPMVMKGLGCSMNYPKPYLRPCGDIDIWLFGKHSVADKHFEPMGTAINFDNEHHSVFQYEGFTIENHQTILDAYSHKSNGYECAVGRIGKGCGTVIFGEYSNSISKIQQHSSAAAKAHSTMDNKFIYHYTTIETLALILGNHTIRFSRLDTVDDIEESEFSSGPTNVRLGNYVFASCWTRCEEESIAQWKIYAGYDGVRITMVEDDLFQTYDITPEFTNSMQSYFKPPFSPVGKDAICSPRINPVVCEDVVYTDDTTLLAKDAIIDTGTHTALSTTNAGKYKRKIWEFQKECRFKFLVYPMQESTVEYLTKTEIDIDQTFHISAQGMRNIIQKKMPISQEYYDATMSATALNHLQVMLGPRTSVAQETIVKALLNQYAPKAVLRHSELKLRK